MKIRRYQFDEDGFMRLQKDIDALINNRNLDHQHIGRLYTEYCDIRSENGETIIEGPTLKMYDRQAVPVKRLQMGYNSADADFNLTIYDAAGNPTIYLNSTGEAVFAGNIETLKNAKIGQILELQATTGTDINSGIKWMDSDGVTVLADAFMVKSTVLNLFSIKSNNSEFGLIANGGNLNLASLTNSVILRAPGAGIVCRDSAIAGNKILTSDEIDDKIATAINNHLADASITNSHVAP